MLYPRKKIFPFLNPSLKRKHCKSEDFLRNLLGFSGGSAGKESTCNVGDLDSICIRSLGWEAPLEKRKATHSSIENFTAQRFHGLYSPWGHKESDTTEPLNSTQRFILLCKIFFPFHLLFLDLSDEKKMNSTRFS